MSRSIKLTIAALLTSTMGTAATAAEVNIYSYRQPQLINPILDEFTKKTGIKTNVVFAKKGLDQTFFSEHNICLNASFLRELI